MVTTSKSMHREVQIRHDLMTRKCKYTLIMFNLDFSVHASGGDHRPPDRHERFDLKYKNTEETNSFQVSL